MKRITRFLVPTLLALALGACGGSSEPVAVADPLAEVPASASKSSAGMAGYMGALAAMPSDSREPVAVDTFNPPKPEDTEPEAVGG
ncbi:MAG: hypothetical protein V4792_03885 [Pseudomonadota bacterium]